MWFTGDGWVQRNWHQGEFEQRREGVVEDEEYDAAREWLRHVEAGRIGQALIAESGACRSTGQGLHWTKALNTTISLCCDSDPR
jgi:hypothetical protein